MTKDEYDQYMRMTDKTREAKAGRGRGEKEIEMNDTAQAEQIAALKAQMTTGYAERDQRYNALLAELRTVYAALGEARDPGAGIAPTTPDAAVEDIAELVDRWRTAERTAKQLREAIGNIEDAELTELPMLRVFLSRERAARAKAERERDALAARGDAHCPTCICGKRAPVQGDHGVDASRLIPPGRTPRGPGTIAWSEHLQAWSGYAARYGTGQSAERLAERGGFSYGELYTFLGREPTTWEPRR